VTFKLANAVCFVIFMFFFMDDLLNNIFIEFSLYSLVKYYNINLSYV
jgi:hypothetical protein